MNLGNEDEKKGGLPPIMGSFKKSSSFGRVPGFSRAAGGIMARLKNLSKKDMAFVGIGLSVLVMAPVAEYLISKPSADNLLSPGFGGREKGSASGLYEPGINGLSQGSTDGSGEVITPLSARDPLSLILGPQSSAPPAPPAAPNVSLRDAMKDAGRSAFSEAAKSAGAPTPIPRLQSGLRAMGSFFSGGESSRSADALSGDKVIQDAKNASRKSAARSMLGPVAMAGYKGVASTPNSASKGAFEKLRSQADKSAGNFGGENAGRALDRAAADALDIGKGLGGLGAGGEGEKTRGTSNSSIKDQHSFSGETLEQMAAKQRLQKALDWEFFKKYEIPKQIIQAALDGIVKRGLMEPMGDLAAGTMKGLFGLNPATSYCWQPVVCPSGDCADAVKDYNNEHPNAKIKAPIDLCYKVGAQKFTWESAGKDKASGGQVNCICGKGAKPIGKEYIPGAPAGAPPPPGGPGLPPGATEQVSATLGGAFADYDAVLQSIVNLVIEAEGYPGSGAELAAKVGSVAGGFTNLGIQANNSVKGLLAASNSKARSALAGYSGTASAAQGKFAILRDQHRKYFAQAAQLKKDLDSGALKTKTDAARGAQAVSDPQANAKIKEALDKWQPLINSDYYTAEGLLNKHTARITAYTQQLSLLDGGVNAVISRHLRIEPAVKSIMAGNDTVENKLAGITGREKPVAPVQPGRITASVDLQDDMRSAVSDPAPAPLREAADLRGLAWDTLWAQGHKFDSSRIAAAEAAAWEAFDSKINLGGDSAGLDQPDSFVSNLMRGEKIQVSVAGYEKDFPNIESMSSLALNKIGFAAQEAIGLGADQCYFADGGCSGAQPAPPPCTGPDCPGTVPPAPVIPVTIPPAVNPTESFAAAKNDAINSARADLGTAAQSRRFAENKNAVLQDFKPKTPRNAAAMDRYKDSGNRAVENIKSSEAKIGGIIRSINLCRDQSCLDARQNLIAKELAGIRTNRNELDHVFSAAEKIKKSGQPAVVPPVVAPPVVVPPPASAASSICYKSAKGCSTVSAFYLRQHWEAVPVTTVGGVVYSGTMSGAVGQAWSWVNKNYKDRYTTARRDEICAKAFTGAGMALRSWINFHGPGSGIEDCKKKFFSPVYSIEHNTAGTTASGRDVARIVASKTSGNDNSKGYAGSAQSNFNVALELLCARSGSLWRVTSASMRIDRPVMYTESSSFNFNVGRSAVSAGMGTTLGRNTLVSYGQWQRELLRGGICGSNFDGEDK